MSAGFLLSILEDNFFDSFDWFLSTAENKIAGNCPDNKSLVIHNVFYSIVLWCFFVFKV